MAALVTLDLAGNPITTLPPWIAELPVSNFAWPSPSPPRCQSA